MERIYAGTFLSSLDMAGISISVLGVNDEWLRWLDAATTAPAWPNALKQRPGKPEAQIAAEVGMKVSSPTGIGAQSESRQKNKAGHRGRVQSADRDEGELTEMDRVTGDGDLGTSMERAAKAVLAAVDSYPLDDVPATLKASVIPSDANWVDRQGRSMECFFCVAAAFWRAGRDRIGAMGRSARSRLPAISELGGAKPGDRTMLDALDPFVKALKTG